MASRALSVPGPAAVGFAPTERFPPAPSFNTEVTNVRIQPVLVECSLPMALDNHLGPFQPKLFHDSNKEIISCG